LAFKDAREHQPCDNSAQEEYHFPAARSKAVVLRSFVLSHVIHHRGQLSVYLRLLDVPVPSMYGPSADEPAF
jgi:uncharacterized damage-inducible protein DinB